MNLVMAEICWDEWRNGFRAFSFKVVGAAPAHNALMNTKNGVKI
jgi:hypothetical protein